MMVGQTATDAQVWLFGCTAWCVRVFRTGNQMLNMYFCGCVVIFVMTFLLYSFLQMLFFFSY